VAPQRPGTHATRDAFTHPQLRSPLRRRHRCQGFNVRTVGGTTFEDIDISEARSAAHTRTLLRTRVLFLRFF
jgi:hypothetical protein